MTFRSLCKPLSLGLSSIAVFAFSLSISAHSQNSAPVIGKILPPASGQKIEVGGELRGEMKTATDEGRMPGDQMLSGMHLLLERSPEQNQALQMLNEQVRTPGNPMFQHTITPAQFTQAFAIPQTEVDSVKTWLRSQGLTVDSSSASKLYVAFSGSAQQVEDAFGVEIHIFRSADEQLHFAATTSPHVPAQFAGIVSRVINLQDFHIAALPDYRGPVSSPSEGSSEATISDQSKFIEATGVHAWSTPGGQLTMVNPRLHVHPDLGSGTTTVAVTLTPATVVYASNVQTASAPTGTPVSIVSVITWTAATTPTGTVTISDADAVLSTTFLLSSCTLGTKTYTCTYPWTAAASNAAQPTADTITTTYSGDANYATSNGTKSLTITKASTGTSAPHTVTIAATPTNENYGAGTAVSLVATVSGTFLGIRPTGPILITGSGAIGGIAFTANMTSCTSVTVSLFYPAYQCTYSWTPSVTLFPGAYTLTVSYGGDTNYKLAYGTTTFTINSTASVDTTTTVTDTPTTVTPTVTGTTFTTVTSYTGAAAQPIGTISLVDTVQTNGVGSAVYPLVGATTSNGSGTDDGGNPYTYSCTTNTSALTVTCTIVNSNIYATLTGAGPDTITGTYSGDETYLSSNGSASLLVTQGNALTTYTPSVQTTPIAYGASEVYLVTLAGNKPDTTSDYPEGTVTITGLGTSGSPNLGTLYTFTSVGTCPGSSTTDNCTSAATALPATAVPGTYNLTYSYSGDATYAPKNTPTVALTVSTATPTVAVSSPVTGVYGAPVTLTATDTGAGAAYAAPTGTATFTVNGVTIPGTATCTAATDVETCSLTYTPAGSIGIGIHTGYIAASFAADTNYKAASSTTSGTLTITAATPTITFTPNPLVTAYGSTTNVAGSVAFAGTGVSGDTTPTGNISITAPTGFFGSISCSITGTTETCTTQYTPSGTCPVGNNVNYITITMSASNNYTAATGYANLNCTQASATAVMTSPVSTAAKTETYGALAAFSVAGTLSWTSVGGTLAPTKADLTFVSTAAGAFSALSCTGTSSPYSCTATFTPTATDAPGSYNINLNFSGDTNYAATVSTQAGNFVINKATVTLGTMTFSPAATEPYGTSQAITISDTLIYSTTTKPTGAVTYTLNGVAYTAACTGSATPLTCTAVVPAATIAALPVAAYTVTAGYTTDTYYAAATGTSGTFTITQNSTTTTLTAVPTSIGPGGSSTVTATVVNSAGSGATPQGSVAFTDTTNAASLGSCTLSAGGSCGIAVAGTSLAVGANTIKGVYTPSPTANWLTSNGSTTLTLTAAPTTTISLTPLTTGSTTTGVTTATLTANLVAASNDGAWGGTVTFKNSTTNATYTGTVTGSGTTGSASVTITLPNAGTAAGLDTYTATYAGTTSYQGSGPSNSVKVYWQGVLISTTLNHNFSSLISYGSPAITVEGTIDGTKLGPFGIVVFNFTPSAQTVGLNFTNASSGAFSYVTNCPTSLPAGKTCNYYFYYLPPNGDGCNPTTNCTKDGANYPQGTYEAGTWQITSGATLGIGDTGFDRSGPVTFPATLAGKAVLPPNSPISVSPLTYTFGPLAPNALSKTLTITVTNSTAASVGLTYTPPVTTPFQATNYCPSNLAANSTCTINVTFQSSSTGTVTDAVGIKPAGGTAISVSLTGIVNTNNGLQLTTNAHNFGNVATGTSATAFGLSITNNASTAATLSFGTSQSGTTPYNVGTGGCPASLAAGAQCSVIVNFSPTAVGSFTDVLTVNSNQPILPNGTGSSPNYSATVTFTGSGVASGQFTATSVGHNWGNVTVGTTATNYGVQLTNTTPTALTLSLGSGFMQGLNGFNLAGSNCGATLATNASCELIFSFSPTGAGQVSTTYGVTAVDTSSNPVQLYSGGSPYSAITLMGTGQ